MRTHFGSLRAFVCANPGQFPDLPERWADSKWAGAADAAALVAPAPDPGVAPPNAGRWAEDARIGPADSDALPPLPGEATAEAKADPAADSINTDAQWPEPAPLVGSSESALPGSSASCGGSEVVRAELHAHLER